MFCDSEIVLRNGVLVPCRHCGGCHKVRRIDFVGRCRAEEKTSHGVDMFTWTYGKTDRYGELIDHPNAYSLDYEDPKRALKRCRNHLPYEALRFFVAGEYGEEKGRAHYHILMFWQTAARLPNMHYDIRYQHTVAEKQFVNDCAVYPDEPLFWAHGFTQIKPDFGGESFHYVAKYLHKDGAVVRDNLIKQSRKPLLGARYICALAEEHVDAGLSPQDLTYRLVRKGARPFSSSYYDVYHLTAAGARYLCRSFVAAWLRKHNHADWPRSRLIDDYLDMEWLRDRHASLIGNDSDFLHVGDQLFDKACKARAEGNGWWTLLYEDFRKAGVPHPVQKHLVSRGFTARYRDVPYLHEDDYLHQSEGW